MVRGQTSKPQAGAQREYTEIRPRAVGPATPRTASTTLGATPQKSAAHVLLQIHSSVGAPPAQAPSRSPLPPQSMAFSPSFSDPLITLGGSGGSDLHSVRQRANESGVSLVSFPQTGNPPQKPSACAREQKKKERERKKKEQEERNGEEKKRET